MQCTNPTAPHLYRIYALYVSRLFAFFFVRFIRSKSRIVECCEHDWTFVHAHTRHTLNIKLAVGSRLSYSNTQSNATCMFLFSHVSHISSEIVNRRDCDLPLKIYKMRTIVGRICSEHLSIHTFQFHGTYSVRQFVSIWINNARCWSKKHISIPYAYMIQLPTKWVACLARQLYMCSTTAIYRIHAQI